MSNFSRLVRPVNAASKIKAHDKPLTRAVLDEEPCPCGRPTCDGLGLGAWCHPGPVYVRYQDGMIHLECGVCRAPCGRVAVAAEFV